VQLSCALGQFAAQCADLLRGEDGQAAIHAAIEAAFRHGCSGGCAQRAAQAQSGEQKTYASAADRHQQHDQQLATGSRAKSPSS